MSRLPAASLLLACLLFGSAAHAQSAAQKRQLLANLALPADAKLSLLDSQGKPIGYDEFMRQATVPGTSFSKDVAGQVATLRINTGKFVVADDQTLKIKPGEALPAFALRTAQGLRISNADFAGHYTVLSFYFAECVPCIAEVPALNALAREHKDIRLLSVTFDSRETALAFANKRGLKIPSLVDAQDWIDALGIKTYPTLMLVDPHGRLAAATISSSLAKNHAPTANDFARWIAQHRKP